MRVATSKSFTQQNSLMLALVGSAFLHAVLLFYATKPPSPPAHPQPVNKLSAHIATRLEDSSEKVESPAKKVTPSNEDLADNSTQGIELPTSHETEPSEILFVPPPENPGMSTSMGWGGRRYQTQEQRRTRTISDFLQKLQPLMYQINPERCVLQASADGYAATLECISLLDKQQLLSGIGPFLTFPDQLPNMGACFTMVRTQITTTKKCAPG